VTVTSLNRFAGPVNTAGQAASSAVRRRRPGRGVVSCGCDQVTDFGGAGSPGSSIRFGHPAPAPRSSTHLVRTPKENTSCLRTMLAT
jgi:hypothetical protein